MTALTNETARANGQLIAETFNVLEETGLTPRQLLEQRNAALDVINYVKSLYISFPNEHPNHVVVNGEYSLYHKNARDVLAKIVSKVYNVPDKIKGSNEQN